MSTPDGRMKAHVLAACLDLVRESGADGLTMRGIAARCRIGTSILYGQSLNKSAILAELSAHGCRQLAAWISDHPGRTLESYCRQYVQFAVRWPGLYPIMFRTVAWGEPNPAVDAFTAAIAPFLPAAAGGLHRRARSRQLWLATHAAALAVAERSGGTEATGLTDGDLESYIAAIVRGIVGRPNGSTQSPRLLSSS